MTKKQVKEEFNLDFWFQKVFMSMVVGKVWKQGDEAEKTHLILIREAESERKAGPGYKH